MNDQAQVSRCEEGDPNDSPWKLQFYIQAPDRDRVGIRITLTTGEVFETQLSDFQGTAACKIFLARLGKDVVSGNKTIEVLHQGEPQ